MNNCLNGGTRLQELTVFEFADASAAGEKLASGIDAIKSAVGGMVNRKEGDIVDNVKEQHVKIETRNLTSDKAADVGENVFIQEHKLTQAPTTTVTKTSKTEHTIETEVPQYTDVEKTGNLELSTVSSELNAKLFRSNVCCRC